MSLLLSKLII